MVTHAQRRVRSPAGAGFHDILYVKIRGNPMLLGATYHQPSLRFTLSWRYRDTRHVLIRLYVLCWVHCKLLTLGWYGCTITISSASPMPDFVELLWILNIALFGSHKPGTTCPSLCHLGYVRDRSPRECRSSMDRGGLRVSHNTTKRTWLVQSPGSLA